MDLEEPIPKVSTVQGYISYVYKEEPFLFWNVHPYKTHISSSAFHWVRPSCQGVTKIVSLLAATSGGPSIQVMPFAPGPYLTLMLPLCSKPKLHLNSTCLFYHINAYAPMLVSSQRYITAVLKTSNNWSWYKTLNLKESTWERVQHIGYGTQKIGYWIKNDSSHVNGQGSWW